MIIQIYALQDILSTHFFATCDMYIIVKVVGLKIKQLNLITLHIDLLHKQSVLYINVIMQQ